jgi:hypothetical protein
MKVNNKLIVNLFKTCLKVNQETKHHVFFDYSPHVNLISIRLYSDGWDTNTKDYTLKKDFYISGELCTPQTVDEIIELLVTLETYL